MQQATARDYVRGAFYGLSAVCIWAAFIVVSRLGVRTSLTPWDVAAIRFAVAGILLLPYLIGRGLALDRLGWVGVAAVVMGCGAPMVLLVNAGLLFASDAWRKPCGKPFQTCPLTQARIDARKNQPGRRHIQDDNDN